jgi:hypothetical protein
LKRQANGGPEPLLGHAEEDPALTNAPSDVNVDGIWTGHDPVLLPVAGVKAADQSGGVAPRWNAGNPTRGRPRASASHVIGTRGGIELRHGLGAHSVR